MLKFFFLFILILNGCVSSNSVNRKLANEKAEAIQDSKVQDKIEQFIRKELKRAEKTKGRYKVLTIPIAGLGSVSKGQELKETKEVLFFEDLLDQLIFSEEVFKKFIFERFSDFERYQIIDECYKHDFRVGQTLSSFHVFVSELCSYEAISGDEYDVLSSAFSFLKTTDLVKALKNFPVEPQGVHYDGQNAKMIYENQELKFYVNIITGFLTEDKTTFRKVFFDMPKEVRSKFTFNTYTAKENSKVEPFDLIHQNITEKLNSRFFGYDYIIKKPISFISMSKIVKKALAQALLVSNEKDIFAWQAPSSSLKKGLDQLSIMCANGIFETSNLIYAGKSKEDKQSGGDRGDSIHFLNQLGRGHIVGKWTLQNHLLSLLKDGGAELEFRCGIRPYKLKIEKIDTVKIPEPKPFSMPEASNTLMTIALSEEVGVGERALIKRYLNYLEGWTLVKDYSVVDTKNKFDELFQKADIYLPVSHAMDVNRFLVGTEKSQYIVLQKKFQNKGSEQQMYLHLLLPSGGQKYTKTVTYDVEDLSKLYSLRRKNKKSSLFLMNISCDSDGTLGTWTHVYRKSVEKDIKENPSLEMKDFRDLPYIIGSDRAFDTASTAALAKHINFPLEAIRILGEGGTSRDVVSFLKNPVAQGFLDKMTTLVASLSASGEDKKQSFEPVFNLDIPDMMTYGGFEVELKDIQTGKVQTY